MGLFGKKKDFTAMEIEEARRFNATFAPEGSAPTAPTDPPQSDGKKLSFTASFSTSGDEDAALAALMEQALGEHSHNPIKVTQGESVTVTSVQHMSADDPHLKEALAAMGFGSDTPLHALGLGPQAQDSGFSAELEAIERDFKGKPVAEAKAAIEAALKRHHHTVPDMVVDMIAKGVSAGTTIDVKFGGAPPTLPAS